MDATNTIGLLRTATGGGAGWQFISQGEVPAAHLFYIQLALDTGCKWVQLRLKEDGAGVNKEIILKTGLAVSRLCADYGALFILNDHVDLVGATGAHGVHLGLRDCDVKLARRILGKDYIIGGTANTQNDMMTRALEGVDYIGLGPYRFTATKKNLSPVLGIEGYRNILGTSGSNRKVACPVYAIGGIVHGDLPLLFGTNIDGVAVCGWLTGQVGSPGGEMAWQTGLNRPSLPDDYRDHYARWKAANRTQFDAIQEQVQGFENLLKTC